jgi:hypothetical protein
MWISPMNDTLHETNTDVESPWFPLENGGFSTSMLVYRRVQIWVRLKILDTLRPSVLTILALNIGVLSMSWDGVPDFETVPIQVGTEQLNNDCWVFCGFTS